MALKCERSEAIWQGSLAWLKQHYVMAGTQPPASSGTSGKGWLVRNLKLGPAPKAVPTTGATYWLCTFRPWMDISWRLLVIWLLFSLFLGKRGSQRRC